MKEHKRDIKNFSEISNTAKHANNEKHSFDLDNSNILSYESNWKRRIIKESLFTNEMQNNAINDVKFKLNVFK